MHINQEPEYEQKPMRATRAVFIEHFNKKGEKMVSAPDIYEVANQEKKSLKESLKKDFQEDVEITSTQIKYLKNFQAEITHDAGSTVVKPKSIKVKIPVYSGDFEENEETEKYLQALFDTKDDLPHILKVLRRFGKDTIRFWTPSQESRQQKQVRSVGLGFYYGRFYVGGFNWIDDYDGLARGVKVSSEAAQTSKGRSK